MAIDLAELLKLRALIEIPKEIRAETEANWFLDDMDETDYKLMRRSKYSTMLNFESVHIQSTVLQILSEENFFQKTNAWTSPS